MSDSLECSPQIELAAARRELELAREFCPHWDYYHDNEGDDCCHRVSVAHQRLRAAKRAAAIEAGEV